MAKPKIKTTQKVFSDVSPASDTPALPTSKPVIVTSRPLMRDPMMAPAVSDTVTSTPAKPTASVSHERTIMPLGSAPVEAPVAKVEAPVEDAPAEEELKSATPAAVISSSIPDAKEEKNSDYTTNPDAEIAAEEDDDDNRRAHIQELIESEKYFLPVDASELKKARRFAVLGFVAILILGAAWADVSLDAGLVHIGDVKAPTHFFSN